MSPDRCAGGKVVRSTKRGKGCVGGFAANFIGCFAAVVGAQKYGRAPLMIKSESRAFGARGKHADRASPVEMHPYPRFAVLPPAGEVCSLLALGPHKHNKA